MISTWNVRLTIFHLPEHVSESIIPIYSFQPIAMKTKIGNAPSAPPKKYSRLPPTKAPQKIEVLNPEEYKKDQTMLTIIFHEEDHTLGNALKHVICQMPGVEFCGYNIPHPLEDKILFRIQTEKGVVAGKVLCNGLKDVRTVFDSIQKKFVAAHEKYEDKKRPHPNEMME